MSRKHRFAEGALYTGKSKYVGTGASDAERLRELETANAKLKGLLAESTLDQAAFRDAQSGR